MRFLYFIEIGSGERSGRASGFLDHQGAAVIMDNNKDLFFHTGGGVDINQDFLPIGTSTEKFVTQHFFHAGGWNYRQSGFLDAQSFADLAGSLLFGQSRRRLLSVVVIHQVARAVIFHDFPIVQSHRHLDEIGVKGDIVLGKGILNGADVVIDHIIAFCQILDAVFEGRRGLFLSPGQR